MKQAIIDKAIKSLRFLSLKYPKGEDRLVFLFLCGGDDANPKYICRKSTKDYLKSKESLHHVITVKPEILLEEFKELTCAFNLLELEAIIAELSDAILLFAESPGSICELGAFSMSDATQSIMTACVSTGHRNDSSFIIKGPIQHIEQNKTDLSSVIYLDMNCPLLSFDLELYFHNLQKNAQRNYRYSINSDSSNVSLGSFCRECLDLITLFEPIKDYQLLNIYKQFKGFSSFQFNISTLPTIPRNFSYKIVFAYLASAGIISYKNDLIAMKGPVPSYFMFSQRWRDYIQQIRATIISARKAEKRDIDNGNS